MQLDNTVIATLRTPIRASWNYIAHDVYDLCGDDEEAMEMAIDAGRLTTNAEDASADALVISLVKEHGYHTTLAFLSKHIPLL
jgi:hypothetical protein